MNQKKKNKRLGALLLAIVMLLGIATALHRAVLVVYANQTESETLPGSETESFPESSETAETQENSSETSIDVQETTEPTAEPVPAETQTEESTEEPTLPVEVSFPVRYLFVDGSLYAEYEVTVFSGTVLDGGDLPLLPDAMVFIDDFVFYEVRNDGTYLILRYVRDMTDTDKDGIPDDVDTDDDNDGVNDQDEQAAQLDPKNPDSNADGIQDGDEDSDEDGLKNREESDASLETITDLNTNGVADLLEKATADEGTQTDPTESEEKAETTELVLEELQKLMKKSDELKEKIEELSSLLSGQNELSEQQKATIKEQEENIAALKKELSDCKAKCQNGELSEDEKLKKLLQALEEQMKALEKANADLQPEQGTALPSLPGASSSQGKPVEVTPLPLNEETFKEQEAVIRYPNKLSPKTPENLSQNNNADQTGDHQVTTKGVASPPSTARGTVTENVTNGNQPYPIHHGNEMPKESDASQSQNLTRQYSADSRQFITFTTKSGKTFHLIINHDESSDNVMLLTEVDEDDLLNMVEEKKKDEPLVTEEPPAPKPSEAPAAEKPEEKKESHGGMVVLLVLAVLGTGAAAYYFKVVKPKEDKTLEELEEPYDEYCAEATPEAKADELPFDHDEEELL